MAVGSFDLPVNVINKLRQDGIHSLYDLFFQYELKKIDYPYISLCSFLKMIPGIGKKNSEKILNFLLSIGFLIK